MKPQDLDNLPRASDLLTEMGVKAERLDLPKADPAPSGLQLAEKQIFSLLDNMTDDPIRELRELRDEIDDTIRTYQSNQKALAGLLTHHREIGESAKAIKPIAAEAMRELQDRLRSQTVAVNKLVNGSAQ